MDLDIDNIRQGGVYIKKGGGIGRQVLSIDRWRVEYRALVLANGVELTTSRCLVSYLARWAERATTPTEYA